MKKIFTLNFLFWSYLLPSQITIQSSHLPDAGDTLITRNAQFLVNVDPELTGANYTWDFGFDVLQPTTLNAGNVCYDVNDTPLAYQFLFNNPFDPSHNSDFAQGVQQAAVGTLQFEDAYQYYKNGGNVYSITGLGSTINGIPLAAQMNDPDVVYNLPLTFGTSGSSVSSLEFDIPTIGFYGTDQTRTYACDGWGTLNIWDQTFSVIRVRSVVNATDSIYTELFGTGFGFAFPRPESITYEYLSTQYKVPVLKITATAGAISLVQTADIYEDPNNIDKHSKQSFGIYPNPCQNDIRIIGLNEQGMASIYSCDGQLISQTLVRPDSMMDLSSLISGIYFLEIKTAKGTQIEKLIKE
jgi:hypothetical protein